MLKTRPHRTDYSALVYKVFLPIIAVWGLKFLRSNLPARAAKYAWLKLSLHHVCSRPPIRHLSGMRVQVHVLRSLPAQMPTRVLASAIWPQWQNSGALWDEHMAAKGLWMISRHNFVNRIRITILGNPMQGASVCGVPTIRMSLESSRGLVYE